jgi:predicted branched-subunit amino acid permease
MFPLGVTFGLAVVHAGLAWWWTPLFSGLIFGGSLVFLLIVMAGVAAPLAAIALPSPLVQGRHIFYALSFPSTVSRAGFAAPTGCSRCSTRPTR